MPLKINCSFIKTIQFLEPQGPIDMLSLHFLITIENISWSL